ncbi:MAG: alpha/beta fold hydrolase [Acidobacteriaceae bacterium]|nr:alpha/beta fold hydrolase [Acidobacteriaceae bacterium]MBV9767202.1 alpha/beta fold hydrolase [Acidobacteriaceae bacterium]
MQSDFRPIFRNPHLLTIAANYWPRKIDQQRFPAVRKHYRIDDRTTVLSLEHQPENRSRGQILLLHGLEGCADAGYILSFAQHALLHGFGVHRINSRSCGGTEEICETMYHSGLTTDTLGIVREIRNRGIGPIFLVGFSLGGNVALKLAGELGETDLIAGICAVSTPIDLAACVRCTDKPSNFLYARRFLDRLRNRVRRQASHHPHFYSADGLDEVKNIWEFDDLVTARLFGFGTAANYYATQSSAGYLDAIRVPTLVVCAKDDPLVPFEVYDHPAFQSNPFLTLLATEHGGHLGFLSRRKPRFWLDTVALDWIISVLSSHELDLNNVEHVTSTGAKSSR